MSNFLTIDGTLAVGRGRRVDRLVGSRHEVRFLIPNDRKLLPSSRQVPLESENVLTDLRY